MSAFYPASLAMMLGQVRDGTPASHEMILPQPHTQVRPLPTPRPHSSAHRPRPVSMPPTATADRDRQHRQTQKGRSATRVLGDYTLTKTLGAGSMGKVKLAIHNLTDEKVLSPALSLSFHSPFLARHQNSPPRASIRAGSQWFESVSRGHR